MVFYCSVAVGDHIIHRLIKADDMCEAIGVAKAMYGNAESIGVSPADEFPFIVTEDVAENVGKPNVADRLFDKPAMIQVGKAAD